MNKDKFVARCIEALQLADRIIQEAAIADNQIPSSTPAAHPCHPKIFVLAYCLLEEEDEDA
jgi:hypothetical protein